MPARSLPPPRVTVTVTVPASSSAANVAAVNPRSPVAFRATVTSRACVLLDSPAKSVTWKRTMRLPTDGPAAVFSYLTVRRASWYRAAVAGPVRVRTPVGASNWPVMPFWSANRRKSSPATYPAVKATVAPLEGDLRVGGGQGLRDRALALALHVGEARGLDSAQDRGRDGPAGRVDGDGERLRRTRVHPAAVVADAHLERGRPDRVVGRGEPQSAGGIDGRRAGEQGRVGVPGEHERQRSGALVRRPGGQVRGPAGDSCGPAFSVAVGSRRR